MLRFADLKIWVRLTAAIWLILALIWAGAIVGQRRSIATPPSVRRRIFRKAFMK